MNIALITDAWRPQVNGVVRTLSNTVRECEALGHATTVIGPDRFRTVPCPSYPEIRLSVWAGNKVARLIERGEFDAVHIATEGPLGLAARRCCRRLGRPFTTSCHTRFPEYLRCRLPVPITASYAWLRRFHNAAARTLVRSPSQKTDLERRGFNRLAIWPGGVDTELFRLYGKEALDYPRPVAMYMGRIAAEKNLEAFLELDLPGSQVIVGDGPARAALQQRYPRARFIGYRHGEALARILAAADVFVFPSRTDTLGLVMIEALACGVPVAAFPVQGPQDVVINGVTGALDEDLESAVYSALACDPVVCREHAEAYSWRKSTARFLRLLEPANLPVAETNAVLSAR